MSEYSHVTPQLNWGCVILTCIICTTTFSHCWQESLGSIFLIWQTNENYHFRTVLYEDVNKTALFHILIKSKLGLLIKSDKLLLYHMINDRYPMYSQFILISFNRYFIYSTVYSLPSNLSVMSILMCMNSITWSIP